MSKSVDTLGSALKDWACSQAPSLGLAPEKLSLVSVGTEDKIAYHLSDERRDFHLKLGIDPGYQKALRRWQWLAEHLRARYRGPAVVGPIALPQVGATGLIIEHLGRAAADAMRPPRASQIQTMLRALHQDRWIRQALKSRWSSCFDVGFTRHLERFRDELALLQRCTPPGLDTLPWLEAEAARLEQRLIRCEAFREPANLPCHNGLSLRSFRTHPDGRWCWVDWDELELGDPALDFARLWYWADDSWRLELEHRVEEIGEADNPAFAERVAVHFRMLDFHGCLEALPKLAGHRRAVESYREVYESD